MMTKQRLILTLILTLLAQAACVAFSERLSNSHSGHQTSDEH